MTGREDRGGLRRRDKGKRKEAGKRRNEKIEAL